MTLNEFVVALDKEIEDAKSNLESNKDGLLKSAYLMGGIAALENMAKVLKEKVL